MFNRTLCYLVVYWLLFVPTSFPIKCFWKKKKCLYEFNLLVSQSSESLHLKIKTYGKFEKMDEMSRISQWQPVDNWILRSRFSNFDVSIRKEGRCLTKIWRYKSTYSEILDVNEFMLEIIGCQRFWTFW